MRLHSNTTARDSARRTNRLDTPWSVSSASRVADLLGDRNVMRSHTTQAVWREVLSDLGLDRPNMELQAVMAHTA